MRISLWGRAVCLRLDVRLYCGSGEVLLPVQKPREEREQVPVLTPGFSCFFPDLILENRGGHDLWRIGAAGIEQVAVILPPSLPPPLISSLSSFEHLL